MWISKKELDKRVVDMVNAVLRERSTEVFNLAMVMTNSMKTHAENNRMIISSLYGWLATGMSLSLSVFYDRDISNELKEIAKSLNSLE